MRCPRNINTSEMKNGHHRNYNMGFIFWGFIVLFFILVYPQILYAFISSDPNLEENWYIKPGFVACLAFASYTLGVSFTAVVSAVILYFTIPILYRKFCKFSITRYFIAVRTHRTKTKISQPKERRRTSHHTDKDVKVLFSTFQKKADFNKRYDSNRSDSSASHKKVGFKKRHDGNLSDTSASDFMEVKAPLLDKGQQTSQAFIGTNAKILSRKKKTSKKTTDEKKMADENKMADEKKMADVGVQAMRPDSLDPRIDGRINILESRLRLEELRNRAWCSRMSETEECLSQMRMQMRKMQGSRTRHVVDQATNTSMEKLSTNEARFQSSKTMETITVRDKGDHEVLTITEEPYLKQLYAKETKVYIEEHKSYPKEPKAYSKEQMAYSKEQKVYPRETNVCHSEQLVSPNETKMIITELKETSTKLDVPNVIAAELKGYPTEQEVFPSELKGYPTDQKVFPSELKGYTTIHEVLPSELKGYTNERKGFPVEHKISPLEPKVNLTELQFTKNNESEMALIKVNHDYLALTKVEPAELALATVKRADLALTKVDPADFALIKVDPAAQQVKPWVPSHPFPAPLPDDTIYSEDFNILLRRLRAEAGEPNWARVRSYSKSVDTKD